MLLYHTFQKIDSQVAIIEIRRLQEVVDNMQNENSTHYFCQNIMFLRKKHNISINQMAKIMGVSDRTVRNIEKEIANTRINRRNRKINSNYF